jgi:hypothetical protein
VRRGNRSHRRHVPNPTAPSDGSACRTEHRPHHHRQPAFRPPAATSYAGDRNAPANWPAPTPLPAHGKPGCRTDAALSSGRNAGRKPGTDAHSSFRPSIIGEVWGRVRSGDVAFLPRQTPPPRSFGWLVGWYLPRPWWRCGVSTPAIYKKFADLPTTGTRAQLPEKFCLPRVRLGRTLKGQRGRNGAGDRGRVTPPRFSVGTRTTGGIALVPGGRRHQREGELRGYRRRLGLAGCVSDGGQRILVGHQLIPFIRLP